MEAPRFDRPVSSLVRAGVFAFFAILGMIVFAIVASPAGYLLTAVVSGFLAGVAANALAVRIYEQGALIDVGFAWNSSAVRNLLIGIGGGVGSAAAVLGIPLLAGLAHWEKTPGAEAAAANFLYLTVLLIFGAIGEELLFHGYGFQALLAGFGPFSAILPTSVLFAYAHAGNLNVSTLGLVNTGLWGAVLGYSFWRSGDLWLPIGLHFGWNWMLPLFGVNLSGFTMNVTGHVMRWNIGPLWSGGDYGPEGGLLTTGILVFLAVYLWKSPVERQIPLLLRARWEA